MKKKLALAAVLLALSGGVSAYLLLRQPPAQKGVLTLYGNVDIRSADLGFRVGGRIAAVSVEEGDHVAPGEILARLDAAPYRDELDLAKAQRDQAAAQLAKLEAGYRPQEIAQAAALVEQRRAALVNLEIDFRRKKNRLALEAVSRQAYDDAAARLKEGRAELTNAQEALKLKREGFRAEDIAAARADLEAAAARTETAKTRLADTAIAAPATGFILTRVEEPGAIVAAGETVLTLSLENPVWVRAYVDEPDLGRLAPGMTAQVVTDTAPGHPYHGHVGFISPEAEFTPKTVQTTELRTRLVYQVRIVVDDPDHGLRQGMPVTVRLPLGKTEGKKRRTRLRPPSKGSATPSPTKGRRPSTTSRRRSAPGDSPAWSVPTGRARPPCCVLRPGCCCPRPARSGSSASTPPPRPGSCTRSSATCPSASASTRISRCGRICASTPTCAG